VEISGFEIHMGQTDGQRESPSFVIEQRSQQSCSDGDGDLSADGNVVGTYNTRPVS
jgi:cobyric acid synthase